MSAQAHAFPYLSYLMGTHSSNMTSLATGDTKLAVGLIASGTITWNSTSEGWEYNSSLLSGLTEVSTSGTGYTRQALTGVTFSADSPAGVTTLTCTNPSWSSATFSAAYAWFFDATNGITGSDSTCPLLCYWDFGGTQTVTSATFTLSINASGLITWTSS